MPDFHSLGAILSALGLSAYSQMMLNPHLLFPALGTCLFLIIASRREDFFQSRAQVIGAVFDQNAFLYRDSARAGTYLHLAGGMNRDADHRQVFILRADGSVSGRGAGQSVLTSGFGNLHLNPGDTIMVPEKNIGAGAMRQFMAWTEIFSQFALGAAAVNILK